MTITVVENSKDSLAELIAQADKYTENLFTADSFKNFRQALENAKAVYADETADQDIIDSAEASLRAAMRPENRERKRNQRRCNSCTGNE